jgi:diguanylate cyclase (GGDEF)-like protein
MAGGEMAVVVSRPAPSRHDPAARSLRARLVDESSAARQRDDATTEEGGVPAPTPEMEPTPVTTILVEAVDQLDDVVAIFDWPAGGSRWANGPVERRTTGASSAAAIDGNSTLMGLLDEWSQAHFLVRVLPTLSQAGRWEGHLGLMGLDPDDSSVSTRMPATIVAHYSPSGSIDAVTLIARTRDRSTTGEPNGQPGRSRRHEVELVVDRTVGEPDVASALLTVLVEHAGDVVIIAEADGRVRVANATAADLLGVGPDAGLTPARSNLLELIHPDDRPDGLLGLTSGPGGRGDSSVRPSTRLRMRGVDLLWRTLEVTATDLTDNPSVLGIVVSARDVTNEVEGELDAAELAFFDELTGLPNRLQLLDRLDALAEANSSPSGSALVLVDLDELSGVNDAFGGAITDAFLVAFGHRLVTLISEERDGLEAEGILTARLRGAEFAVLVSTIESDERAVEIAEHLRTSLRMPIEVDSHRLSITSSIGVAFRGVGDPFDSLLTDADRALRRAKHEGRDRVVLYDEDAARRDDHRIYLGQQLRQTLDADTVQLGYQPIIDLGSGRVVGVEALLRVRGAEGELLNPVAFVEAAESNGLISKVGLAVVRAGCEQIGGLLDPAADAGPLELSINVSQPQITSPHFADDVERVLTETGVEAHRLCLEIAESTLGRSQTIDSNIAQLRDLGVRFGIDEFGSGTSSVSAFRRHALDFVKLDRRLIEGLGVNMVETMIVRSTIELAHKAGLIVVAVGVETESQLDQLRRLKCDRVQGFLFAADMQPDAVAAFIAKSADG